MAESNPKVLAMVERAIKKDPNMASTELQDRAKKIDPGVGKLSGRQFHAQYALRVRKKLAGSSGGGRKKKSASKKASRKRTSRRRTTRRKSAGRGRRTATEKRPAGPAVDMLAETYEQQKTALNEALDAAFDRAVRADSVRQMNELLRDVSNTVKKYS